MLQGKSVFSRIHNARISLDNAERSFSSNQAIRGELDLMLAEAELQNLRQKRGGRIFWTRHTFAVCAAVLLLAAGWLGWWWASAYGGHTSQAAAPENRLLVVAEEKEQKQAIEETKTKESRRTEREPGNIALPKTPSSSMEEPARANVGSMAQNVPVSVQLSTGQMHRLIRSGKQELGSIR